MTDVPTPFPQLRARRIDVTSDAAVKRLKGRYRAERRFQLYGILAIATAGVFLALLLGKIVIEGLPGFWQHSLVAEVVLDPAVLDPKGDRSPSDIRKADFAKAARNVLISAFPEVTARADRKRLTGLLSTGAADQLRESVAADPSLIGTTQKTRLLLAPNVDLFLKDEDLGRSIAEPRGIASVNGTTGEVTVLVAANDFAGKLVPIKRALAERAEALRNRADDIARNPEQAETAANLRAEATALAARAGTGSNEEQLDRKVPSLLVAIKGGLIKLTSIGSSAATGVVLLPLTSAGDAPAGEWQIIEYATPEDNRNMSDQEIAWVSKLKEKGQIERGFNWRFLTAGDSTQPELAGIRGALVGSALTLLVTLLLSLPIGVMAAIYLEEFARKNWLTDLIEININNLAAVPSIVFGLLGLAVFINMAGLPRSAPLVGGLVLALLVMPTIIIAARAALKSVPPSIKEAALGVGASHQQAVFHHVLPLAMPGILTGTIIGMAHALGETAPLLMIGMVAFVVDIPKAFSEAAVVLPVQVYLWSDAAEPGFQSKTAAAILVLLVFLVLMNGAAIWLRKRFERRW